MARVVGGTTTSRSYSVSANQLTGFSQVIGGTSTSVAYSYNANGDMTSDGLRTYTYDAEGRLSNATTGATDYSPTTRYAHNALGQRVFKTEPQYPPAEGDETDAGFMQSLINFFKQFWSPSTSPSEAYGYAYAYDEQGSLIGEYGMGGAHSSGSKQYVYLPTAAGPMPIVVMADDTRYAVVADHLNTPRRATYPDGDLRWQWGYSAFGDEQPTIADRRFNKTTPLESDFSINLRYPGQYFDVESNLHYNGFRMYNPTIGRYTQGDPIGLDGGWNRFGYVDANPLSYGDPLGLWSVEGGVYLGLGASMSLGRDPATGGTFMSFKFGKGFGWGAAYDPLGGRAGGTEDQACRAGVGIGFYAEAGGNAGPVSGKVEANLGRNFFFGGGNDIYGGVQPKGSFDTNIRGIKGVAAAGVEITFFGARPSR